MFNHINGIFIQVYRFTLELESNILISFSITTTNYIGIVKLRGVIVIIISFKLLDY